MQRLAIRPSGGAASRKAFLLGFVNHHSIGHLDHTSFDSLDVVPGATNEHEHKHVDHAPHRHFALADAHGFDQNQVVSRGFTELNGFGRGASHTSEGGGSSGRADEGIGMLRQVVHARFVSQKRTLGSLRRGVHGQDGHACATTDGIESKPFDQRALAGPGNPRESDAHALPRTWGEAQEGFVAVLVVGMGALHPRDGLRQSLALPFADRLCQGLRSPSLGRLDERTGCVAGS